MSQNEAGICELCGKSLDSREHLEGRGNIHNPDFVPVDPKQKAADRKEFWAAIYAAEAKASKELEAAKPAKEKSHD